jgi:transposase
MANEYWLDDKQRASIKPLVLMHRRGVKLGRKREVSGGILHVLKCGCRWRDCPAVFGPHTTIYNHFNRWFKAGGWSKMLAEPVTFEAADLQCVDSTTAKAHRCSAEGKGGPNSRPSAAARASARPKFMLCATARAA